MTKHVTHISTNVHRSCEHCSTSIGGDRLAESINHYIKEHGYSIIHVGTETVPSDKGEPWHTTVAVLGK